MSATTKWGDAAHLTRALFDQDRIWVTADGRVLKIAEMEITHVLNALLMIERLEDLPIPRRWETALYGAFYARLLDALSPEDVMEAVPVSFQMPNRRIATTRSELKELLSTVADEDPRPRFMLNYTNEAGEESRREIVITEVYERGAGLGLPETYIKAIDVDLCEPRTFRMDRIGRLEEVPFP